MKTQIIQLTFTLIFLTINPFYNFSPIAAQAPLEIIVSEDITKCQSVSVVLEGSVTGGTPPYSYSWTKNPNSEPICTTNTCEVSPYKERITAYKFRVTDAEGNTKTKIVRVTIHPFAELEIEGRTTCENEPVRVTAYDKSFGNIDTYKIIWGDGKDTTFTSYPSNGIEHTYTQTGVFNAIFIVEGENCSAIDTILISHGNQPSIGSVNDLQPACTPYTAKVPITGFENNHEETEYFITLNGVVVAHETHPPPSMIEIEITETSCGLFETNNRHEISVIAALGDCQQTISFQVFLSSPPIPAFTFDYVFCEGQAVPFLSITIPGSNASCSDNTPLRWLIDYGNDGTIDDSTDFAPSNIQQIFQLILGENRVILEAQNNCGVFLYERAICVENPFYLDFQMDSVVCLNTPIPLLNSTNPPNNCNTLFHWLIEKVGEENTSEETYCFEEGFDIFSHSPVVQFKKTGKYRITLEGNCTDPVTKIIEVRAPPSIVQIDSIPSFCIPAVIELSDFIALNHVKAEDVINVECVNCQIEASENLLPQIISDTPSVELVSIEVETGCGIGAYIVELNIVEGNHIIVRADTTICGGEPVLLWATGASEYTWLNMNGEVVEIGDSIIVNPTETTTYQVLAIGGNCENEAEVTIYVQEPEFEVFIDSPDLTLCKSSEIIYLNASPLEIGKWIGLPDNNQDGIFDPSKAYLGTHSITYQFTNGNSCVFSDEINIKVIDVPTIDIGLSTDTICNLDTAMIFSIYDPNQFDEVNWRLGKYMTVIDSSNNNLQVNFNIGEADSIVVDTIFLEGMGFCPDKETFKIIHILPNQPRTGFALETPICLGELTSVSDYSSGGVPTYYISDGRAYHNPDSLSLSFEESGTYEVCQVVQGCGISEYCSLVTVDSVLKITDFNFPTEPREGEEIQISFASNSTNQVVYEIDFGDGNQISTDDTKIEYTYEKAGYYAVWIHATDINTGCKDIIEGEISVFPHIQVIIPSAFSPNGDGVNDLLQAYLKGTATLRRFDIYSRWGHKVFTTNDINSYWDGNYKGKKAEVGVYVYLIIVENPLSIKQQFTGQTSLIR